MSIKNIPKGPLHLTALNLSPFDLISLCQTDPHFNKQTCNDNGFWKLKL